jgi:hypothetical protein
MHEAAGSPKRVASEYAAIDARGYCGRSVLPIVARRAGFGS